MDVLPFYQRNVYAHRPEGPKGSTISQRSRDRGDQEQVFAHS